MSERRDIEIELTNTSIALSKAEFDSQQMYYTLDKAREDRKIALQKMRDYDGADNGAT